MRAARRFAAVLSFAAAALSVVSGVYDDDIAWAACFVVWAIFAAVQIIIVAMEDNAR